MTLIVRGRRCQGSVLRRERYAGVEGFTLDGCASSDRDALERLGRIT